SRFFLRFYRDGRTTTAFEFLEARFGPSTRLYGALTFLVGQLLRISLILFLLGQLTHELTGLSPIASILVSGLFVRAYTAVGGIEAVVWPDVAETVVLTLGGAACFAVVVWKVPGGLPEILNTAWAHGKLSFADLGADGALHPTTLGLTLTRKSVSMMLLVGLGHWLTEYACNQNMVQKYCASASTREARREGGGGGRCGSGAGGCSRCGSGSNSWAPRCGSSTGASPRRPRRASSPARSLRSASCRTSW